jgi:hypothetical protein
LPWRCRASSHRRSSRWSSTIMAASTGGRLHPPWRLRSA